MMEAVRTSETSVDNNFTRQYNPEDSSEHHTRRRENLKSHIRFTKRNVVSRFIFHYKRCVRTGLNTAVMKSYSPLRYSAVYYR
jgi:hypothetical protein